MPVLLKTELQTEVIAARVGRAAEAALRTEAWIAPKPGLVDRFDRGSHRDMDLQSFYRSAETIAPFLGRMAACGAQRVGQPPKAVFALARRIGLEAEAAMFDATGGVNTHKGAIFTLGLLGTAYGYLYARSPDGPAFRGEQTGEIFQARLLQCAGCMVDGIVAEELGSERCSCSTAGGRVYRAYGLTGIRGEAERGFPAVQSFGMPVLRRARQAGLGTDASGLQVLLSLMTGVEDTNVAARGGLAGLRYSQAEACRALSAGGVYTAAGMGCIKKINIDFVSRNLSPGGCADLLAATLFLAELGIR